MARFIIDITKLCVSKNQRFGNRYIVEAADVTAAAAAVDPIVTAEKVIHSGDVAFINGRVADRIPGTDVYISLPLSGVGTAGDATQQLPIVLTTNVQFIVAGFGRPSRKFYHACLNESFQDGGQWVDSYATNVLAALTTLISDATAAGAPIVDPQGQAWVTPVFRKLVGTHQFTKRSRRVSPPTP